MNHQHLNHNSAGIKRCSFFSTIKEIKRQISAGAAAWRWRWRSAGSKKSSNKRMSFFKEKKTVPTKSHIDLHKLAQKEDQMKSTCQSTELTIKDRQLREMFKLENENNWWPLKNRRKEQTRHNRRLNSSTTSFRYAASADYFIIMRPSLVPKGL